LFLCWCLCLWFLLNQLLSQYPSSSLSISASGGGVEELQVASVGKLFSHSPLWSELFMYRLMVHYVESCPSAFQSCRFCLMTWSTLRWRYFFWQHIALSAFTVNNPKPCHTLSLLRPTLLLHWTRGVSMDTPQSLMLFGVGFL
jgi:hypothetical protein